jgi:hypothetical protein
MLKYASLFDLRFELWLRERNRGELVWKTKEGNKIPIKDMTDEHLKNSIELLEDFKDNKERCLEALDIDNMF